MNRPRVLSAAHVAAAYEIDQIIALVSDDDLESDRPYDQYRVMLIRYLTERKRQLQNCDDMSCEMSVVLARAGLLGEREKK